MPMNFPPDVVAYQLAHKDDDIGYELTVTSAIFGVVAVICVISRVISRYLSPGQVGVDDYLVMLAMTFGIILVITACLLETAGLGRHLLTLTPEDFVKFGKINLALQTSYPFTIGFARLSILALYHRLFSKGSPLVTWPIWFCIVYNALYMIGVLLAVYLQCHPLSTIWTSACAPEFKTTLSTSILNIVGDAMVLLLPQPILWGLNLPWQRKLGVSIVMLLGLFTVVISIARIFIIEDGGNRGAMDITYTSVNTYIFTVVEPMTAIICSCLPVMKPVFGWASSSLRSSSFVASLKRAITSKSDLGLSNTTSSKSTHTEYIRMGDMTSGQSEVEVKALPFNGNDPELNENGIWVSKKANVDVRRVV